MQAQPTGNCDERRRSRCNVCLFIAAERSRLVSNVTASWAAAIKSVEGLNSTSVSLTSTIEPEAWLGIWQALPLFFAFVFCVPLTIIAMLVGPSAARTEDSAGNIGCCGDEFISPESFNRSCDVVSRAKRRTTDDQIDPWVADWWRLMALPPLSIVHIASFVVSAIAATGPVFTYKAQGQIIDTANSNVRVDFAEMLYEMSMTTGCLFTNSTKLPRFGYASGMCFDAASPHRLQLSAYRPGDSPTGQDFSVVVMADVASTITKMQGLAVTHAVTSAILVALLLGLAMCNMRQGAAARAFKRWGKLVGVALFVCGILGIVDAATIHDARSSLSRRNEYLKTFSDDGSVSDESLFQQLAAVTNPLVGRLQFVAHSADLVAAGSEGDDLITAVTVLAVFSGLLVLPLAGIICLGTLNGAGVVAGSPLGGAAAQQGTVSRAAASASGNAAKGAHTAAFMKSSAVPSPSAADVARFGCLAGIQDHSARLADQSEAERLAEHVQQVRASGLDENIVAALFEAKPEGVARRARELVGSGGATARAGAFKTAPDSVAVAVAPPPDDAAAAVAVVAPPDDGAASAEAPSSPPAQQPALPLPPMAPNGLGVTSTFEL